MYVQLYMQVVLLSMHAYEQWAYTYGHSNCRYIKIITFFTYS